MEHREDWREVEWKGKQLYNPYMLSPNLCSNASPAKSTVSNLPQILHFHAIWMFRSYSDCSVVLFWSHCPGSREAEWEHSVSRVCVPKLKSCCAATTWESLLHSSECETEFRLIEGFVWGSAQRHPTPLCIWTSPGLPVLLSLYSCACCSRLFSAVTAFPLMLLATNLLSSLSLCPPAGALWVTGSQRKSVIVLETCHWPRYDGSGTESIVGTPIEYLRLFANEVWQGIHARSHRQAAGRSRQWVSHLVETARSRKSAGYGRPALPRSPQRPPL